MDLKSLSNKSTESRSFNPNISILETELKLEYSKNLNVSGNFFDSKNSFKISHEPSLPNFSSTDYQMKVLEELSSDLSLMKKTCCHIISQINKKEKQKYKKKTILKEIDSTCKVNKKKIKKVEEKLKNHEERIIDIERTLNIFDSGCTGFRTGRFPSTFTKKGASLVPRASPVARNFVNLALNEKKTIGSPSQHLLRTYPKLI